MANYCTVQEFREAINTTEDDVILDDFIAGVSNLIDQYCNRPDGFIALTTATARLYSGSGDTIQWIDECTEISTVEVKDSPSDTTYDTWAAGDWIAATGNPQYPDFNRTPYRFIIVSGTGDFETFTSGQYTGLRGFRRERLNVRGVPTVRITAKWGYSTAVPDTIRLACIAQASRFYKRSQAAWANTAGSREGAGELRFNRSISSILDPDIRLMLDGGRFKKPALGRRY